MNKSSIEMPKSHKSIMLDHKRFSHVLSTVSVVLVSIVPSCARGPIPFTVTAVLRPVSGNYGQIEVNATGTLLPGDDIASAACISITLTTSKERNVVLNAVTENFVALVAQDVFGTPLKAKDRLDAAAVIAFMKAAGVDTSTKQIPSEAQELIKVVEAAAMGPKRGLPKTVALMIVSSSVSYE